jgi:Mlc titration factor MtfA (ptsG expression regulator)
LPCFFSAFLLRSAEQDPPEFFALASEAFCVLPEPLAADDPQRFRLLSQHCRQHTLT